VAYTLAAVSWCRWWSIANSYLLPAVNFVVVVVVVVVVIILIVVVVVVVVVDLW